MLIVLTGLSGAGKTICADFLQGKQISLEINKDIEIKRNSFDFKKIITCTTRKPRINEIDKIHYFFLSKENFKQKIKNNEFVEYAKIFDNYYGTLKSELKNGIHNNSILVLDPQGVINLKKLNIDMKTIFFDISLEKSLERMSKDRNDSNNEIEKRMADYKYFINFKKECDYVIDGSQNINQVLIEIFKIIEKY